MSCIDDQTVIDLLAGRVAEHQLECIDLHLDGCQTCRELVGKTAHESLWSLAEDGPLGSLATAGVASTFNDMPPAARYRFGREIARGGMGRIVEAHDRQLGRSVAVKQLLSQHSGLERFAREAAVTARLQHPGIVPLYGAGHMEDGEPYYSMKLVSGRSLHDEVRERKNTEERLELLQNIVQVVEAIAYAHDQGVIHRDLTPANVMVGDFGETVVVDWGLAKLSDAPKGGSLTGPAEGVPHADGAIDHTIDGAIVGTPAYMAPEQAVGQSIDERADVYALGSILYYVLAGKPPRHGGSASRLLAEAASERPVALSELSLQLPRDLIAIVDKAMACDRNDRYASASALAADLRRFQAGQLVATHPYSRGEMWRRWLAKRRAVVAVAGIALVLLCASIGIGIKGTLQERDRATRAQATAEHQRNAAETLVQSMMSDLRKRLQDLGRPELLRELGQLVEDYYESTPAIPSAADRMRRSLAASLLGDVLSDRGEFGAALAQYQAAAGFVDDASIARKATLLVRVALVHQRRGDHKDAATTYETALALFEPHDPIEPLSSDQRHALAVVHSGLADMYDATAELDNTARHYEIAQKIWDQLLADAELGEKRARIGWQRSANQATAGVADAYINKGMHIKAIALLKPAVTAAKDLISGDPSNPALRREHAGILLSLGNAEIMLSHPQEALNAYEAALKSAEELLLLDPTNVRNHLLISVAHDAVGNVVLTRGQPEAALAAYQAAREAALAGLARAPDHAVLRHKEFLMWLQAGRAEYLLGNFDSARTSFASGIRRGEVILDATPDAIAVRDDMAWGYGLLGSVQVQLGSIEDAAVAFAGVIEQAEQLLVEQPGQASFRHILFSGYSELITLELNRHQLPVAEKTADLYLSRSAVFAQKNPDNVQDQGAYANAYTMQGEVHSAAKRADKAVGSFRESLRLQLDLYERSPSDALLLSGLVFGHYNLGRALRRNRNFEAAGRELQQAAKLLTKLKAVGPLSPSQLELKASLAAEQGTHAR